MSDKKELSFLLT